MTENEKAFIKNHYLEEYCGSKLRPVPGGGFVCPFCGSGDPDKPRPVGKQATAGFKLYDTSKGEKRWKCFACNEEGDLYSIIRKMENLATDGDAIKWADDYFNGGRVKRKPAATPAKDPQPKDFTEEYKKARSQYEKTDYLRRRGISDETAKRFYIGFDPEWKNPKAENAPASPRIIFPTGRESYVARSTDPDTKPEYKVMNAGSVHAFNGKALKTSQPVFVTEAVIDALSIIECGFEAVALCGKGQKNALYNQLQAITEAPTLVLFFDTDDQGKAGAKKIIDDITGGKEEDGKSIPPKFPRICALDAINYLTGNLSSDDKDALRMQFRPLTGDFKSNFAKCKDANDMLRANKEALTSLLTDIYKIAQGAADLKKNEDAEAFSASYSSAAFLEVYLNEWKCGAGTKGIKTGFSGLDDKLRGGLFEGLYVLGAASSFGKTSFVLQIADNIASQGKGRPVIIFSLEMSRTELIARSISRHTSELMDRLPTAYENARKLTALDIMTGEKFIENTGYRAFTDGEEKLLKDAAELYSNYAMNVYSVESIGKTTVETIAETVRKFMSCHTETPVIVVDYLQLLSAPDGQNNPKMSDYRQTIDFNVMSLKQMSRDYKMPVIAISSFNRTATGGGSKVYEENFKESGGIEYSADVLIGLSVAGDKDKDAVMTEMEGNERQMQVTILKNRNGPRNRRVAFTYYTEFNQFIEKGGSASKGKGKASKEDEETWHPLPDGEQTDMPF